MTVAFFVAGGLSASESNWKQERACGQGEVAAQDPS